jgi:hypothetical protein
VEELGSPKIKFFFLLGWPFKIGFGWRVVLREGVGPVAGFGRFTTNLKRRRLTFIPIVSTPSVFGEWWRLGLASPPFTLMSGRMISPLRVVGKDVEGCHGKPEGYGHYNHACYLDYSEGAKC